jgi:hypothetical protein
MSILEEMMEMLATTVQVELNAMLRVCESVLQDVLTNRQQFHVECCFPVPVWCVACWHKLFLLTFRNLASYI